MQAPIVLLSHQRHQVTEIHALSDSDSDLDGRMSQAVIYGHGNEVWKRGHLNLDAFPMASYQYLASSLCCHVHYKYLYSHSMERDQRYRCPQIEIHDVNLIGTLYSYSDGYVYGFPSHEKRIVCHAV